MRVGGPQVSRRNAGGDRAGSKRLRWIPPLPCAFAAETSSDVGKATGIQGLPEILPRDRIGICRSQEVARRGTGER